MRPGLVSTALAIALCLPGLAFAGQVTGTVYSQGVPLANVRVSVTDSRGEQVANVTTDSRGRYTLSLQDGQTYTLVVRGRRFPVSVQAQTVPFDIRL